MRHIPEEELHSYLDQALSRSQCVEIERHLARCAWCRDERDGIAALRDRTTALLSALAPVRHRIPPSWESLSAQAAERGARHSRLLRGGLWAASVAAALGLGWAAEAAVHRGPSIQPQQAVLPAIHDSAAIPEFAVQAPSRTAPVPDAPAASPVSDRQRPQRAGTARAQHAVVERSAPLDSDSTPTSYSPSEPVGSRLSAGGLPSSDLGLTGGMWRTLSWDNAKRERGESVPRIRGLPVVEVQVAASRDSTGQPTMIVAQQLRSGQLIHTIEGPATDVTRLLASQRTEGKSPWPTMSDSSAVADGTMAMRHGDRMLAIQASPSVPADSLRAMIRRLNAANR